MPPIPKAPSPKAAPKAVAASGDSPEAVMQAVLASVGNGQHPQPPEPDKQAEPGADVTLEGNSEDDTPKVFDPTTLAELEAGKRAVEHFQSRLSAEQEAGRKAVEHHSKRVEAVSEIQQRNEELRAEAARIMEEAKQKAAEILAQVK